MTHEVGEGLWQTIERLQRENAVLRARGARLEKRVVQEQLGRIKAERSGHWYFRRWMTANKLVGGFGINSLASRVAGYLEAHPEEAKR
jgi:hypothetical protein